MIEISKESRTLNGLLRETHRIYYNAAAKLDLSDSIYDILYTIKSLGEGCLQKDISQKAFLNKQTVNSSVRQLEKGGFIKLVSGKGREKKIYLTDLGKQLISKKIDPVIELEQEAWQELSPHERKEYLRILKKWNELISKKFDSLEQEDK